MSGIEGARNLAAKAIRRLASAHKPVVRFERRRARAQEQRAFRHDAATIDRAIAHVARGHAPIVAGPWLAEVGYEVLYWIPFLRWFCDAHGVPRERLIVVSRGGMEPLYRDLAARYVDIFDLTTPEQLAMRNDARRAEGEGGGQKQSVASALDDELIGAVREKLAVPTVTVCHPSLMFRLFRHVWYDHLPYDLLWRRTRYARMAVDAPEFPDLPRDFVAVKLYGGPALTTTPAATDAVRRLVAHTARVAPVVALETQFGLDEHRDVDLSGIPGVTSARTLMAARNNLAVQIELIARSRCFLGTCGGLAWVAPFLGVPTVAVYDSDALLGPHLFVARQAGRRVEAAPFSPLDLNALARLDGLGAAHRRLE